MKDEDITELMLKLGMRFSIPDVQYSLLDGEVIATQQQIEAFARAIAYLQKEETVRKLSPRTWDRKMSDAWHRNIPDVQKAFDALADVIRSPETDLDEALRRQ